MPSLTAIATSATHIAAQDRRMRPRVATIAPTTSASSSVSPMG